MDISQIACFPLGILTVCIGGHIGAAWLVFPSEFRRRYRCRMGPPFDAALSELDLKKQMHCFPTLAGLGGLGIKVSATTVAKYMQRTDHRGPSSQ